jgi:hypothetical protein
MHTHTHTHSSLAHASQVAALIDHIDDDTLKRQETSKKSL